MSQRNIQALHSEPRVAVQELLRSLEARINIYIEEWWNKVLDNDEGEAEEHRLPVLAGLPGNPSSELLQTATVATFITFLSAWESVAKGRFLVRERS